MTEAEFNTALDTILTDASAQFTWADKLDQLNGGIALARMAVHDMFNLTEYTGVGETPI
jgi:hypothetical protein